MSRLDRARSGQREAAQQLKHVPRTAPKRHIVTQSACLLLSTALRSLRSLRRDLSPVCSGMAAAQVPPPPQAIAT